VSESSATGPQAAPSSHAPDARGEYTLRAEQSDAEAARWRGHERWLSILRLVVFVAIGVSGWLAFGSRAIGGIWTLPPALLFIALLIGHDRVIQLRRRAERTLRFFEAGLARIDGEWAGRGNRGEAYRDPAHPYADDLDVFGEASLFELLCTARTAAGEALLADWLRAPADAATIRRRQEAVRELAPNVRLRCDLSLLGEEIGARISSEMLVDWGVAESALPSRRLSIAAAWLTGLTGLSLLALILTEAGAFPLLFFLAAQSGFAWMMRSRVAHVLAGVAAPSEELGVLAGLLARFEAEPCTSPHLAELKRSLETGGTPPSRRIAQLGRLVDLMDARRNQFFAPIGALLLWGTQIALALERWRARCGPSLGPWVAAAAEVEALCALAGYAYEHPDDVFPEIVETGPVFEGEALGHPLLSPESCVRNDVALGGELRALMMSGSNMSGKSTLLRTVGCACVLGLAGAPVRAHRLRVSPLQVAASIRISDSLQQGASHFFAEITRLRLVVDLTERPLPVLFLLDEVLHGTNSHDRRIGADAVLRGLVERGALGIVTTHDLALAHISDDLAARIENVHFQDHIEEGQMRFDYRLRPGVVTKSNALELMRSVGLDV